MLAIALAALLGAQAAPLEEFERRAGMLAVGGHEFSVLLKVNRLSAEPDFGETVAAVEIRDSRGGVCFRRTFPVEVKGERFAESWAVDSRLIATDRPLFVLTYDVVPSAPLGGSQWQFFTLIGGRPAPLGKPVSAYGEFLGADGDRLRFRVWTGNFFVIVPLKPDWAGCRIVPPPPGRLAVEAERRPAAEPSLVRLFARPREAESAEVTVRTESKVEVLDAEAAVRWENGGDSIELLVEDVWLHIRVDGTEGWIHTEQDFDAIGLPAAG